VVAIRLEHVVKSFDGRRVLDVPRLEVREDFTLVLIGPSGCGKSTLLRLVTGLVEPDSGAIEIDGEPVRRPRLAALRRKLGYVIQEGGLFPHMTARANATLPGRRLSWPADRIETRLGELCALAKFDPALLDRFPLQLSGGERQRVSLMRALFLDPPILLMDEPLGGLDPMIRSGLQLDLRSAFAALKKCVIFVTHDMSEAAAFGHEVALLRDGRIVQQGPIRSLLREPADPFVTRFIQAQKPPEELWAA
jgi:osmoprotectant transport system ATP-binding protein